MNRRALAVALAIALPLVALNEATIAGHEPQRLRFIPVEDSAAFARCKAAGNYIEMTDVGDAYDSTLTTRPLWCEERP